MYQKPHVFVIGAGTLGMCSAINLAEQHGRIVSVPGTEPLSPRKPG